MQIILLFIFFGLSAFYYYDPFVISNAEVDKVFLTLSTFLFALFTGFFVSRQATRYSNIQKLTADFDGNMSALYRMFDHMGDNAQRRAGEIIKAHYDSVLENGWDYHFMHQTSTLSDLHDHLETTAEKQELGVIKKDALTRILTSLHELQKIRKNMVALHDERIPQFEWLLIYILTVILVLTVSIIPSSFLLLASTVKSAFAISVFVAVLLIQKLDALQLFNMGIGGKSANDVVAIIKGQK